MRVVLVHPAGSNWIPGRKDLTVAANRIVPIGLLAVALSACNDDEATTPTTTSSAGGGGSGGAFGGGAVSDHAQELIDLIQRTIKPDHWDVAMVVAGAALVLAAAFGERAEDLLHRRQVAGVGQPAGKELEQRAALAERVGEIVRSFESDE